jgi:hypothetical protein
VPILAKGKAGGNGTGRVRGEDLGLGGGMVKRAAGKAFRLEGAKGKNLYITHIPTPYLFSLSLSFHHTSFYFWGKKKGKP